MINKITSCLFLLIVLIGANLCYGDNTGSQYPLKKGSYWIYRGNIKWTPEGVGQKIKTKALTWKMSIHDVIESPEYRIALLTGFPGDVAWYEEGMTPQYSLLVQHKNCIYLNDYGGPNEALKAAKAMVDGSEVQGSCILDFPLTKGKKYDEENKKRTDNMYVWYVEEAKKVNIKVKGYKGRKITEQFTIIYRTVPDHIIMEFVPGLGITRYVYEHHGTVAFEDLRLIEYGESK